MGGGYVQMFGGKGENININMRKEQIYIKKH